LSELDPSRLAILVGAGVSVEKPSCLPTAFQFLREFYKGCLPAHLNHEKLLSRESDLRFETVLGILQHRFDEKLEILDLFNSGTPNLNHRCLNLLARRGALIITTNFDTLAEQAGSPDLDYTIRASDDSFASFVEAGPYNKTQPEFWHLHGIIQHPRDKHDFRDSVVASIKDCWLSKDLFRLDQSKGRALEKVLADRDLLIVGYSGSDDYDIGPALEEIRSARKIFWVCHTPHGLRRSGLDGVNSLAELDGIDPIVSDYTLDGLKWYRASCINSLATMISNQNRLEDNVHLLRCDTSMLLKNLAGVKDDVIETDVISPELDSSRWVRALRNIWPTRSSSISVPSSSSADLGSHFKSWFDLHIHNEPSQYVLAALIYREANLYQELYQLLSAALPLAGKGMRSKFLHKDRLRASLEITLLASELLEPSDTVRTATFKAVGPDLRKDQPLIWVISQTGLGRAHLDAGRIDDAISCFRESLRARRSSGFVRDIEVALYDLANALFIRGYMTYDLAEAEAMANEALESAQSVPHPEGIARSLLLLGRINERRNEIGKANDYYQLASDSAFRSGNEDIIAVCHGEFGMFLLNHIVNRDAQLRVDATQRWIEGVEASGLKEYPEMMQAVMGSLIQSIMSEPTVLKGAEREKCLEASKHLAEAFRIHHKQQRLGALSRVAGNLAQTLEMIDQGARSLLADCAAYRCAVFFKNHETVHMSLGRIRAGAKREFPEHNFAGLSADKLVETLQKLLIGKGIVI
jgi:tetratricopeptide (TPR) repeat protein